MYDRLCPVCGAQMIDCWEPIQAPAVACEKCGAATERAWFTNAAGVIGDDIPGGLVMEHIVPGHKVYSKSELRRVAAAHGYQQHVEHVAEKGSDKSRHTSRWI